MHCQPSGSFLYFCIFAMNSVSHFVHNTEFAMTLFPQTPHGSILLLYSLPSDPLTINFVFLVLTFKPLLSSAFFQFQNLFFKSSMSLLMITRSSAYSKSLNMAKKNILMTATYCAVNTKGNNRKKNPFVYPNRESAIRSIPHCNEIPVPVFKGLPELKLPGSEEDKAFVLSTGSSEDTASDVGFPPSLLQFFSKEELNDLIGDLNLSKESSELPASRLEEKIYFSLELS